MYLRTGVRSIIDFVGRAAHKIPRLGWVELWAPCFKVAVAGTTGSGDATIAVSSLGWLRDFASRASADDGRGGRGVQR